MLFIYNSMLIELIMNLLTVEYKSHVSCLDIYADYLFI